MTSSQPEKLSLDSLDIAGDNRAKLKALFPSVFAETRNDEGELVESIDFEKLKAELGSVSDVFENRRERYGMDWPGKKDCIKLVQQPATGTLKPCREASVNFDSTENLFIEGDNLEVLKLLQKSYYGKVKMIYIDPPYNTGKEFIYPDNYAETLETYLSYAGLADDEGKKFSTNTANDGRFHTKWLNMIHPRLYLAKNLLREDGFIVVSIDDGEFNNLTSVISEVFGEDNYVANLVWDKNRKNDAKLFSVGHEYMLVYAKNKAFFAENKIVLRAEKEGVQEVRDLFLALRSEHGDNWNEVNKELKKHYKTWDKDDPRKPLARYNKVDELGPYRDDGNINWPGGGGPRYAVIHPTTKKPCAVPKSGWRYPSLERMQEEISKGRIVFGHDEKTVPGVRSNLFEATKQVLKSVHFSYAQTATNEFNKIFNGKRIFENPKHYADLETIIDYLSSENDDLILDFFSGSCSTADAVLRLNNENNGSRKFIMIQLPESCSKDSEAYKENYQTVSDIGKERIRRVIQSISHERRQLEKDSTTLLPGIAEPLPSIDLGFKVLKLDRSNFKPWNGSDPDATEAELAEQLALHIDHINPTATQEDLLYELLLKAGFMPTEKIETHQLADHTVYAIADGALLICLENEITKDLIDAIVTAAPQQFLCLDKAFNGNDQLKANAVQTFNTLNQNRDKDMSIIFKTI
ncbi:MAG: site-specific DNA-methyltransferase [Cyanobacteria bacterium P01_D01_bin.105]